MFRILNCIICFFVYYTKKKKKNGVSSNIVRLLLNISPEYSILISIINTIVCNDDNV